MQDKYFHTTDTQSAVLQALNLVDAENNPLDGVNVQCGGAYFQNSVFILFWVGKIPKTFDADGNPLTYEADGADHFNVRPISGYPDFGTLTVTEIETLTPYAIFA